MPHTRLSGLKAASTNKHLTRLAVKTDFIPLNLITFNSKIQFILIMSSGRGRGGLFQRGGQGGQGGRGGRGGGLIGSAVRGVAGGIGLVSESVSSYKEKRAAEKTPASSEPSQQPQSSGSIAVGSEPPPNYEHEDSTERQWELDETQSELLSSPQDGADTAQQTQVDKDLVSSFLRVHGSPSGQTMAQLELPVILAQRRPKDRTRGFVRGYAPMLETAGIDQAAWLDFLDKFDQSTRASPWIEVINFAELGGFFVPIAPSIAISAAVYKTIEVAKDVQGRQR